MLFNLLSNIYKFITSLRNSLFDSGFFEEYPTDRFSIGVGNLTVGGTGKTPMVNYLISIFNSEKISVISRGYGRKTKGFLEITAQSSPNQVGDEPYMLAQNNPKVNFFVSEKRTIGYANSRALYPENRLFIFDDVYQHRHIKPTLNVLLCDYNRPFYDDYLMPKGRLRETRKGAQRADIVVVTKTPIDLGEDEKKSMIEQIKKYTLEITPVYFANYIPSAPKNHLNEILSKHQEVILISALANNHIFSEQQSQNFLVKEHFEFKDHHSFSKAELTRIIQKYPHLPIITTEKDMVKINSLIDKSELSKFYIPVINVEIAEDFRNTLIERFALH